MFWYTIIGFLAFCVIIYLWYSGAFAKINFVERDIGPFHLVCRFHKGPYSEIGNIFDNVDKLLKKQGIETLNCVGIYYDNPSHVSSENLRSNACFALEQVIIDKHKDFLHKNNLSIIEIPLTKCVVADYPLINTLSIILAVYRVYPKLIAKKIKISSGNMEIYMHSKRKMTIAFPQENHKNFILESEKKK